MSDRKYSEEQMSEILRAAAERSTAEPPSYALSDIQRIAAEADIAPEHVAQAAAVLPVTPVEQPSLLLGEPARTHVARRVGRKASANDMLDALTIARQLLGETGETRDVAGGVEWRYDSGYSGVAVSIVPDGDGTVIRVDGRADGRQFVLQFGAVAAALLTGFLAGGATSPTFSALTAAAALVPYAAAARFWWNRSARRTAKRLADVADALAERLGGS